MFVTSISNFHTSLEAGSWLHSLKAIWNYSFEYLIQFVPNFSFLRKLFKVNSHQTKLLTGIPKDKIVPRTHPLVIFVLHILEKSSYTPHWDRAHIFLQGWGYSLKTVFSSHPVCRRTSWKADVLFSYRDVTYLLSQTEFSLPSNIKATQGPKHSTATEVSTSPHCAGHRPVLPTFKRSTIRPQQRSTTRSLTTHLSWASLMTLCQGSLSV